MDGRPGLTQVEPSFEILGAHGVELNAPLRIVPGSHGLGRLPETEIEHLVATPGGRLCLAKRGDVWLYATPIVHAFLAADPPQQRRVLQVDFSADATPGPLAWRGV